MDRQASPLAGAGDRNTALDALRGFAILLVIVGHSDEPHTLHKLIYGFHMPLFFLLTGYLFHREKWLSLGFAALCRDRLRKFVAPYFILSFLNLVLKFGLELLDMPPSEALGRVPGRIFGIFYANGLLTPNCAPLWYLPCVFLVSLMLYGLLKLEKPSARLAVCVAAVAVNRLIQLALPYDPDFFWRKLPWHIESALIGLTFAAIGFWIKETNLTERMDGLHVLCLLPIGFYAIVTNTSEMDQINVNDNVLGNVVLAYAGAVCVSLALLWLFLRAPVRWRLLPYFGRHTVLVVGLNLFMNAVVRRVWLHLPGKMDSVIPWWIEAVGTTVCFLALFFVWDRLKKRFPRIFFF